MSNWRRQFFEYMQFCATIALCLCNLCNVCTMSTLVEKLLRQSIVTRAQWVKYEQICAMYVWFIQSKFTFCAMCTLVEKWLRQSIVTRGQWVGSSHHRITNQTTAILDPTYPNLLAETKSYNFVKTMQGRNWIAQCSNYPRVRCICIA